MEASAETKFFPSNIERPLAATGVAVMLLGAGVVWYLDPTKASIFPACPLYSTTGFACPGCGLTRGFHALFHGEVVTALDFNALIPVVIVFLGYIFFSMASVAIRGRGFTTSKWNLGFLWGLLALLIVFGVVRNLPFYPFTILFP